ncbi:hypothetical protein TWF730_009398 [Orbilia blumenaviensis]|uniref:F-box domain-containing protein n=1 Tax=Orbilia blumenaviensis TaxID=1796055 RepID=A0AAV9UYX5_9PEZI
MVASLTTLPAELLAQILSRETGITSLDISNCSLVCRRLYNLTVDRKTKYSFHVDHRSQSAWHLIRCILSNPTVGTRIQTIVLTWHRRRPGQSTTWTPQWIWRSQESAQIREICKKWGIYEFLYPVIEDGFDSEALLPLLLCLTPNLESLDLGNISPGVIYGRFSANAAVKVFKACDRGHLAQNYKVRHNADEGVYFDCRWGASYRRKVLWFHTILSLNICLPGMSNLKHFCHGYVASAQTGGERQGWPAKYVIKVLLLPKIETAYFHGAARSEHTRIERQRQPLSAAIPRSLAGKKSTIKNLEFVYCDLEDEDYSTIAKLTGSLEKLVCPIPPPLWFHLRTRGAYVAKVFAENNKDTLKRSNISTPQLGHRSRRLSYITDVYFPFKESDEREDREAAAKQHQENKEGLDYIASRIWNDDEYADDEYEEEGDWEPCDHEFECHCEDFLFDESSSEGYEMEGEDWWQQQRAIDAEVALRTRDVKGTKKRSHFVN